MTLGKRLEEANRIALKRAKRIRTAYGYPLFTPEELEHLSRHPPSKKDRPHKDVVDMAFEPAMFRKFNGTCDCSTCKAAKADSKYKSKGKNKRKWWEELA
jgi:hypothetical protein